jgi:hypothetical protein
MSLEQTVVSNPDLQAQVANLNAVLTQLSSFASHITVGGASAHILEWAKGKPGVARWWDLLSGRSKTIVGGLLAFFGSIGISAAFSHDPQQAGVYSIVLTGVTLPSIGSHLWGFIQSWVLQQGWYSALIKPTAVTGVPEKPVTAGMPAVVQPPIPVVDVKP